jgi:hypothetical protein
MPGPKYIPPALRAPECCELPQHTFERFGTCHLEVMHRYRMLVGQHMSRQGGTWSCNKQEERAELADADWAEHDRTGNAFGYYWIVYRGAIPIAIVGCHRMEDDSMFTFRSYFTCKVPEREKLAIIKRALQEFQGVQPRHVRVWSHIRGASGGNMMYCRAGFQYIGDVMVCQGHGKPCKSAGVYTYDLLAAAPRVPSPDRIRMWLGPDLMAAVGSE